MRLIVDNPTSERNPLWCKEQFLSDLARLRVVLKVCDIYADEKNSRVALNYDVWRWQKTDADFDRKVKAILTEEGTAKPNAGRPRKDGGDKSWQSLYCEALVEFDGNEEKARTVSGCPYSLSYLREMIEPRRSAYDENFAKMVWESWQKISSEFQGIFFSMRKFEVDDQSDDPEKIDISYTKMKIAETKARIAQKAIEKIDRERWGPQVNVQGSIQHQHHLMDKYRNPLEIMSSLAEDRKRFVERRIRLLKSGGEDPTQNTGVPEREMAVVDAEVVEDGGESLSRDPEDD